MKKLKNNLRNVLRTSDEKKNISFLNAFADLFGFFLGRIWPVICKKIVKL